VQAPYSLDIYDGYGVRNVKKSGGRYSILFLVYKPSCPNELDLKYNNSVIIMT
jgi:hypothetical protein